MSAPVATRGDVDYDRLREEMPVEPSRTQVLAGLPETHPFSF